MGKVWLDADEVGTFTPQTEGTSGNILLNSTNVGTFELAASGYVYLNETLIGTYLAAGEGEPPGQDARYRTKVYLSTYLNQAALTKDDGSPAVFAVMYAYPDYALSLEFLAASNPVDVLFLIGKPNTESILARRYNEHVPITISAINKTGITGVKLCWKAEAELRRVTDTQPLGSTALCKLETIRETTERIGSATIYSTECVMTYRRSGQA